MKPTGPAQPKTADGGQNDFAAALPRAAHSNSTDESSSSAQLAAAGSAPASALATVSASGSASISASEVSVLACGAAPNLMTTADDSTPDESAADDRDSTIAWLTPGDRLIILLIAATVLAVSASQWAIDRWYYGPKIPVSRMPVSTYRYKIDVNSADWIELSQLEAVGPTLAKRIVASREELGPYTSIDDLVRVKGIGKKTFEKFRDFVVAGPVSTRPVPGDHSDTSPVK